jgi:hypothetical protein
MCWSALVIFSRVLTYRCVGHVGVHVWLRMEMYGSYISDDIDVRCRPLFMPAHGAPLGQPTPCKMRHRLLLSRLHIAH